MEAKLKEYRALRRRKELIENAKNKLEQSKNKFVDFITPNFFKEMEKAKDDEVLLIENEEPTATEYPLHQFEDSTDLASETSEVETVAPGTQESWRYFIIKWSIYFIIWLTLYAFFLKMQFGAVFFVFSVLIGIYLNTRTGPRRKGEVSAYSVFNKDCASIDGTLNAEQLMKEMMYGAAVR
ncbi:SAYSvFN domain-containing protein 1 [Leguminivora glycinivorella]|uniref:SAYSvFN domain-containing protein 1 n=1 Tax=Leguminivora glycinivorella TaxID=1035111 RepID=UPI00200D31D5|nr:SAYSvFN domain-containing protein 1 [Leguminivora glycinivorella]